MSITLRYQPIGAAGLAGYAAGYGRRKNREKEEALRFMRSRQLHREQLQGRAALQFAGIAQSTASRQGLAQQQATLRSQQATNKRAAAAGLRIPYPDAARGILPGGQGQGEPGVAMTPWERRRDVHRRRRQQIEDDRAGRRADRGEIGPRQFEAEAGGPLAVEGAPLSFEDQLLAAEEAQEQAKHDRKIEAARLVQEGKFELLEQREIDEAVEDERAHYTKDDEAARAKLDEDLGKIESSDRFPSEEARDKARRRNRQQYRAIRPKPTPKDQQPVSIEDQVKKGVWWSGGEEGKGTPWVVDPETGIPKVAGGWKPPEEIKLPSGNTLSEGEWKVYQDQRDQQQKEIDRWEKRLDNMAGKTRDDGTPLYKDQAAIEAIIGPRPNPVPLPSGTPPGGGAPGQAPPPSAEPPVVPPVKGSGPLPAMVPPDAMIPGEAVGASGGAPAGAQAEQPPQPQSKAEFDALPSGAVFRDPEGNLRRKP